MERIKEAVEKARQERARSQPDDAAAVPARKADERTDSITYTQTRSLAVPTEILREKRVLAGYSSGLFHEAFRVLRTQILQRLKENNWNVLGVTSAIAGEGKTLTAINLAMGLAMETHCSVLLVDGNLRNPSLHSFLGLDECRGLGDYLLDDAPLPELLVNPAGVDRFVVLPGGRHVEKSSEMLNSRKMIELVEELKTRYPERIVIFDLPAMLSAADTLAFSPYVEACVLVIEEGKSTAEEIQTAVSLLEGTNVLGTVLNKADVQAHKKEEKKSGGPGFFRRLFSRGK